MEDSIIVNQSAIDRGLFSSTFYRTYREICSKNHGTGEEEVFCRPDTSTADGGALATTGAVSYQKIGADGFVPVNSFVESGDALIGKILPIRLGSQAGGRFAYKNTSTVIRAGEYGHIDKVCANDCYWRNQNGEGYAFARLRVRQQRFPQIGDKLASRMAQKGTIGMT
jgi:DNA-directed RNA polymerase II subunit RPB2